MKPFVALLAVAWAVAFVAFFVVPIAQAMDDQPSALAALDRIGRQ